MGDSRVVGSLVVRLAALDSRHSTLDARRQTKRGSRRAEKGMASQEAWLGNFASLRFERSVRETGLGRCTPGDPDLVGASWAIGDGNGERMKF